MALAATSIFDIRTGGSDTANGGSFNPAATLTADGAATNANTSAPVFTSASYTFVAGDVGSWLFIKSGTNWTPGWYQIASVSAGAATLTATVGTAVLYSSTSSLGNGLNTVAGCATTASPSSASWTVDYSQQTTPISITGATSVGVGAIISTTSATKAMIGNGIVITAGTNFTTGYYQITTAAAGSSVTVDRNCTTGAGALGAFAVGGALLSPGFYSSVATVSGTVGMLKYNASAFVASTTSTNVTGGCMSMTAGTALFGYDVNRSPYNTDANLPTYQVGSAVSAATLIAIGGASVWVANVILDGNNQTTSRGYNAASSGAFAWRIKGINFTNGALIGGSLNAFWCQVTGCSAVNPITARAWWCEAYSNTITPFNGNTVCHACLSYNNTGATTDGFAGVVNTVGCVSYNNARDGFRMNTSAGNFAVVNCIAEGNAAFGFNSNAGRPILVNCASYNNTSGRLTGTFYQDVLPITGSGSFFTNAAGADFSLNNTTGAGALCRAAGFPISFPTGTTASFEDVGAAQAQSLVGTSVGGGGDFLIIQARQMMPY